MLEIKGRYLLEKVLSTPETCEMSLVSVDDPETRLLFINVPHEVEIHAKPGEEYYFSLVQTSNG